MKAIIWTKFGPPSVLQLAEIPKPEPKDNEILINIKATTVSMGDCEVRSLRFPSWLRIMIQFWVGIFRPRIKVLGQELAGDIVKIGNDVNNFVIGEKIYASPGFKFGTYAEYICLPTDGGYGVIGRIPQNMDYSQATTLPLGGFNAIHYVTQAKIHLGKRVLIIGAGGSIGTYAVQIVKSLEAEVTAVDSEIKSEMLLSIGADYFLDYTKENFTNSKKKYDVIIDLVAHGSLKRKINCLEKTGIILVANPRLRYFFRIIITKLFTKKKIDLSAADFRSEYITSIEKLIESGKVKAIIDRTYPLEETSVAHEYVETGNKLGSVVITV